MGGEDHCRQLLYFDGDPSSTDLARLFGIPVLAVIDGSAMAQTFGAVAHGLATYRDGVPFAGVLANSVSGEGHYEMLAEGLPPGIVAFGWLARDREISLPSRYLGLVGCQ